MKYLSILAIGLLSISATSYASHDLIAQPIHEEVQDHYDMHDLKHWLLGYPQVNLSINDGVATITGHVDGSLDVSAIVRQVEMTAGVQRIINLMDTE